MNGGEEHYSRSISMLFDCHDNVLCAKAVLSRARMKADERRSWVKVVEADLGVESELSEVERDEISVRLTLLKRELYGCRSPGRRGKRWLRK